MKRLAAIFIAAFSILALQAASAEAAGKAHEDHGKAKKLGLAKHQVSTESVQGKSESTPDQNGTGPERDTNGTDKPGDTGGLDSDRDGNNGCGNDTDRDDDNEGWCGKKPKPRSPPEPPGPPGPPPGGGNGGGGNGGTIISPGVPPITRVLSETTTAGLAKTGANLRAFLSLGLALIALGTLLKLAGHARLSLKARSYGVGFAVMTAADLIALVGAAVVRTRSTLGVTHKEWAVNRPLLSLLYLSSKFI